MKYRSGAPVLAAAKKLQVGIWDVALDIQNALDRSNVIRRLADGTIVKRHLASLAPHVTISVQVRERLIVIDCTATAAKKLAWLEPYLGNQKSFYDIPIRVTVRPPKTGTGPATES